MEPALTRDRLANLLIHLDPSGSNPGQRYEEVRQRLIKFFDWRGCHTSDELADATIDRVARLLGEGREVTTKDAFSFFHGVAQNILREHWAKPKHKPISLEEVPGWQDRLGETPAALDVATSGRNELMFGCLEQCSNRLPSRDCKLIVDYYTGEKSTKIAKRKELAEELGITTNALRIRAHRIREELESCVAVCAGSSEQEE